MMVPYFNQSSIVLHAPSVTYFPTFNAVKMFFCVVVYTGMASTTLDLPCVTSRPLLPRYCTLAAPP